MTFKMATLLLFLIPLGFSEDRLIVDQVQNEPDARKEALIAKALARAAIEAKDVPDYELLPDKRRIVLLNKTEWGQASGYEITERALPSSDRVEFLLHSKKEIQGLADTSGDFLYLAVGAVTVQAGTGTIRVGTRWAKAVNSQKRYLSGGGYELSFYWMQGNWVFDRILSAWIS